MADTSHYNPKNALAIRAARIFLYLVVFVYILRYTFMYWTLLSVGFLASTLGIGYCISCIGVPRPHRRAPKLKKFRFVQKEEWKLQMLALTTDKSKLARPTTDSFLISETIDEFVNLVIDNFVDGWFRQISSSTLFQDDIRIELKSAIETLRVRLEKVDFAKLLVTRLLPIVHDHLQHFIKAENAVYAKTPLPKIDSTDFHIAVAHLYDRGKIHPGVTIGGHSNENEKAYLRRKMSAILPYTLSDLEKQNDISISLVSEILACTILCNIFQMVGEGDFYNLLIVKFIGDNLKHRGQVKQLRAALEEHAHQLNKSTKKDIESPTLRKTDSMGSIRPPDISVTYSISESTDSSTFKEILKSANSVATTHELKDIEKYVMFQLKNVSKVSSSSENEKLALIKKLQILRSTIQDRYISLSKATSDNTVEMLQLLDILAQPSASKLFAEYLSYRNKLYLLQFWQAIDLLKAPLEDATIDDDGETNLSLSLEFGTIEDITNIYHQYLESNEFDVDYDYKGLIEKLIFNPPNKEDSSSTVVLYKQCRKVLFRLQKDVYQVLNEGAFQSFKRSTLFSKLVNLDTIKSTSAEDNEVSAEVLEAIENAFTQIMQNPNEEFSSESLSSRSSLSDSDEKPISTINMKKNLFGETSSLFGGDNNRNSKLFDDISDDSMTDSDSIILEGSPVPDSESLVEQANDLGDSQVFLAAPGDLSLAEEISKLTEEIDNLAEQLQILDPLLKKAELTNNTTELRILRKSKISLDREINSKELQKQQYIVQENDNSLYGKSKVSIQSYISGNENGKEFILYIVEVQKLSSDDPHVVTAGWIVARRFSQFFKLHEYLRSKYSQVASVKFPKRTMSVLKFQQRSLVDIRKAALEEYLQEMIKIPEVCSNKAFRSFLSSENFNIRKNQAFEEGFSNNVNYDMRPKNNIETVANKLYNGISNRLVQNTSRAVPETTTNEEMMENIKEMQKELKQYDEAGSSSSDTLNKVFVRPICDLLITLFRLNNSKSWLRGRALVVILQQIFGTTIEKKVNEQINLQLRTEESILDVLIMLKNTIFPGGKFKDPPILRTLYQQSLSKQEAKVLLGTFMNETCSKIFGSSNTAYASSNVFAMLQNEYLNKHLLFEMLDEILECVFPECKK